MVHPTFEMNMSAIIVLIIISLLVALGFLAAFIWSVKSNQYEDTYTPSLRILFDDDHTGTKPTNEPGGDRSSDS
jgi:cbb3-type cytochrome oxidase maturation protein